MSLIAFFMHHKSIQDQKLSILAGLYYLLALFFFSTKKLIDLKKTLMKRILFSFSV